MDKLFPAVKFNDTGFRGQKGLTVVQAVEVALQPMINAGTVEFAEARLNLQERMLAELVAVLRDNNTFNDDDVLRLIGRYRFEKAV